MQYLYMANHFQNPGKAMRSRGENPTRPSDIFASEH